MTTPLLASIVAWLAIVLAVAGLALNDALFFWRRRRGTSHAGLRTATDADTFIREMRELPPMSIRALHIVPTLGPRHACDEIARTSPSYTGCHRRPVVLMSLQLGVAA